MLNKTEDDERSDGEDDETRDRRGVWVEMHHETSGNPSYPPDTTAFLSATSSTPPCPAVKSIKI